MNPEQDLKFTLPLIQERIDFCSVFVKAYGRGSFKTALENWSNLYQVLKEARDLLCYNLGDKELVRSALDNLSKSTIYELMDALNSQLTSLNQDRARLDRGSRQKYIVNNNGGMNVEIEKNSDAIATVENAIRDITEKLSTVKQSSDEINNLLSALSKFQKHSPS